MCLALINVSRSVEMVVLGADRANMESLQVRIEREKSSQYSVRFPFWCHAMLAGSIFGPISFTRHWLLRSKEKEGVSPEHTHMCVCVLQNGQRMDIFLPRIFGTHRAHLLQSQR